MSEQLLNILKLFLLALLYLFFFRVLRAVWAEIGSTAAVTRRGGGRRGRRAVMAGTPAGVAAAGGPVAPRRRRRAPNELTVVEPAETRGRKFPLADELTVGRAAGCSVTIDDTYVSQVHARVFRRDGQLYVEDLGSTNGTYLNRNKVSGPMVMRRGDRLQVGNTVLEVQ